MPPLLRPLTIALFTALAAVHAVAAGGPAAQVTRPAGYQPMAGDAAAGEQLFNDTKLSTNGMSCASCHANHGAFQASFAKPYPHTVAMAKEQLGIRKIHLDEMVQACMVMPMAAQPFPWDSKALADLTAYMAVLQKSFQPKR